MMVEKTDVKYSAGWIRGRMAADDESSGMLELQAGRDFAVLADEVIMYYASEPGTIMVWLRGNHHGVQTMGSLSEMNSIMDRHNGLREVYKD